MATHTSPITITGPDTSGNVYQEPSSNHLTNDLYGNMVWVFKDSGTKISLKGLFKVAQNYVGTPKIRIIWACAVASPTARDVVWDVDYRAIASAESMDPTTHQESLTVTTTSDATAFNQNRSEVSLTAGNLAVGDLVELLISRDGADAADTLADEALMWYAEFEYADA